MPDNSFSLGVTLQEIDLYTTDENWGRIYIDRTLEKNKGKPMNKVLKMHNLGVYYKTKETEIISKLYTDDDIKSNLANFCYYDTSGRSLKHVDDYLVIPIRLEVKLT